MIGYTMFSEDILLMLLLGLALLLLPAMAIASGPDGREVWHSQYGQDQYVAEEVYRGVLKGGYYVEVGAADGRMLSNALALEERYGWSGLCVEPSRQYAALLHSGRRCIMRSEPLGPVSGKVVEFIEDVYNAQVGEKWSISSVSASRRMEESERIRTSENSHNLFSGIVSYLDTYDVAGEVSRKVTRTLGELLEESHAPPFIHFLSIDTEGSEHAILSTFPFHRWTFGAIAVEHNHHRSKREALRTLFHNYGYIRTACIETDDMYAHVSVVVREGLAVDPRGCNTRSVSFPCPTHVSKAEVCLAEKHRGRGRNCGGHIFVSIAYRIVDCMHAPL